MVTLVGLTLAWVPGASAARITTYAGSVGEGEARSIRILPQRIALRGRELLVSDTRYDVVRAIDIESGKARVFAGNGSEGFAGDGGSALSAKLDQPHGLAVDPAGNVYVADTDNHRIRMINVAGTIVTVAGSEKGFGGDNRAAKRAMFNAPEGIAIDGDGNLYIADTKNHRVRKVTASGVVTTIAGIGTAGFGGDGGAATQAQLNEPTDLVVDSSGNVYVADSRNRRVRRIGSDGIIVTAAGTGARGYSGDGGLATSASFRTPNALALDDVGNLLITDVGKPSVVRRVDVSGIVSTVAGSGSEGFSGDGGPATAALFDDPSGLALDGSGNIYVADRDNGRIRRVDGSGIVTSIAGNGLLFGGDGGRAKAAQIEDPVGVAVDPAGTVIVADRDSDRIREIDSGGTISSLAGFNFGGAPPTRIAVQLNRPAAVAVDTLGNVYIADTLNNRIRKIDAARRDISTIAGTGAPGSVSLNRPTGIAVDIRGVVYFADTGNNLIRRIDRNGQIATVAGDGRKGFAGDGGSATGAALNAPRGVGIDLAGNIYIADTGNHRIRRIDPTGEIRTIAGTGSPGFSGEGGRARRAALNGPEGLGVDRNGDVYIADRRNHVIRKIDSSGRITTVVGRPRKSDFAGDGGDPVLARLSDPTAVALDQRGNLYIADLGNHRIRRVDLDARAPACLGSPHRDVFRGTASADVLCGNGGDDTLHGAGGADALSGGSGNDRLYGGKGSDRIRGGAGNDRLVGGGGSDTLYGGRGNDVLVGGAGPDRIIAGAGRDEIRSRDGRRDVVRCGSGRDVVIADRLDQVAKDCERVKRSG